MAEEVEDLVVQARPEGIDDTVDGLEQMDAQFEDTADSMDAAAGEFEELQQKWQGALGALVGGVAVAVGGLLNEVPVLAEVGAGIAAVLDAIGLQIDQLLRDLGAGGLVGALFKLSEAIATAEGPLGDLLGSVSLIAGAVLGAVSGYLAWITATQGLVAAGGVLVGWIQSAAATISGFVSASLAAAGALGVFIGLAGLAVLQITGILDVVRNLGREIGQRLPNAVVDGIMVIIGAFGGLIAVVGAGIAGFVQGTLRGGLEEGLRQAVANMEQVLSGFIGAWFRTKARIVGVVNGILNAVEQMANSLVSAVVDAMNNILSELDETINSLPGSIQSKLGVSGSLSGLSAGSISIEGVSGGGGGGFSAQRGGGTELSLDGRSLVEQDGRYRRDETAKRGRDG